MIGPITQMSPVNLSDLIDCETVQRMCARLPRSDNPDKAMETKKGSFAVVILAPTCGGGKGSTVVQSSRLRSCAAREAAMSDAISYRSQGYAVKDCIYLIQRVSVKLEGAVPLLIGFLILSQRTGVAWRSDYGQVEDC